MRQRKMRQIYTMLLLSYNYCENMLGCVHIRLQLTAGTECLLEQRHHHEAIQERPSHFIQAELEA